jgi:HD-GYP domain-containing protein (c-di-GMP phosphodiesterase class II)
MRVDEPETSVADRRAFVVKLALAFKLSTLHALTNDALRGPTTDLERIVADLFAREGSIQLELSGSNFFLNDEAVRLDAGSLEGAQLLAQLMERLKVGRVEVRQLVTAAEILSFLKLFQDAYGGRVNALSTSPDDKIAFLAAKLDSNVDLPRLEPRQYVLRSYAALVAALHDEMVALTEERRPRLVRLRRFVQVLCDASQGHEHLLVALGRLQQTAGLPAYHLAATASLTLVMARRLGVGRKALVDLTVDALFHDVGLLDLPPPIDEEEFKAALDAVPTRSVVYACAGGAAVGSLERLAVAWEHGLDIAAEPPPGGKSRLIGVACAFDRMTAKHPPGLGLSPEKAVRYILYQAGGRFDPWAAKLLVNTIGLFPVGTTVRLSDGSSAIVIASPAEPEMFMRPVVRLCDGMTGAVGQSIDLATRDDLTIVGSISPVKLETVLDQFMRV